MSSYSNIYRGPTPKEMSIRRRCLIHLQDPSNGCGSEKCLAQRVIGRERVREGQDDRFGTRPLGLRGGVILCLSVEIGPRGMNAPRRR
jgi:hypothetical protein